VVGRVLLAAFDDDVAEDEVDAGALLEQSALLREDADDPATYGSASEKTDADALGGFAHGDEFMRRWCARQASHGRAVGFGRRGEALV